MARVSLALHVASSKFGQELFDSTAHVSDVVNAGSYATDKAAFESALATCVADGATPTQAHVTAANTAYTTFKADLAAPPSTPDVVLSFDTTKVVNKACLQLAVAELLRRVSTELA